MGLVHCTVQGIVVSQARPVAGTLEDTGNAIDEAESIHGQAQIVDTIANDNQSRDSSSDADLSSSSSNSRHSSDTGVNALEIPAQQNVQPMLNLSVRRNTGSVPTPALLQPDLQKELEQKSPRTEQPELSDAAQQNLDHNFSKCQIILYNCEI